MRLIVSSNVKMPPERLRELIEFGARGVRDDGVEVHVKRCEIGVRGRAYGYVPEIANVAATSKRLVVMAFPGTPDSPHWMKKWDNPYRLKRLAAIFPLFPFEGWEDSVVYLAAHEFRHVWQDHRRRRAKKAGREVAGKREHDAEKHGLLRLNEWRVVTGRPPIVPVKQPNPFAKAPPPRFDPLASLLSCSMC